MMRVREIMKLGAHGPEKKKTHATHTVVGRFPAPPKELWNDGSPVNTNQHWFPMASKWC